ncbi:hypothetical protein [Oceaniglobus trochenteri]|uniref:hypothetical protein n=1 Tax=Oceaniglobus trochenteri TaxID=2763260 RepID=UPI001CFFE16B|nr:hypothetical protein [Oceaniglobus trochenteri]
MKRSVLSALALALTTLLPQGAAAQTEQDFINAFGGEWYVFEPSQRQDGDVCAITLSKERKDDLLPAVTKGCAAPLSTADSWLINQGQIVLSAGEDVLAVMGGNQFRITGELSGSSTSLVIERAQGDGNSARIAAALRKHKCYYLGFGQDCAEKSDLSIPEMAGEPPVATIRTLANLNARAQPRRDAATIGNIAQGTEVRVNQCLTASDGPWCRARIGENVIWLAMTALRQDEWPIVTYRAVAPGE